MNHELELTAATAAAPVLRVTHLDANELDESLIAHLKQTINQNIFKYMRTDFFQRYQPEILAALKFALWYHTYHKSSQTVAQSVLDWTYANNPNTRLKKLLHAVFYCLDEWLPERFLDMLKFGLIYFYARIFRASEAVRGEFKRKVERVFSAVKAALNWLTLANYLVFLTNGKYMSLFERLLGLEVILIHL